MLGVGRGARPTYPAFRVNSTCAGGAWGRDLWDTCQFLDGLRVRAQRAGGYGRRTT